MHCRLSIHPCIELFVWMANSAAIPSPYHPVICRLNLRTSRASIGHQKSAVTVSAFSRRQFRSSHHTCVGPSVRPSLSLQACHRRLGLYGEELTWGRVQISSNQFSGAFGVNLMVRITGHGATRLQTPQHRIMALSWCHIRSAVGAWRYPYVTVAEMCQSQRTYRV